MKSDRWRWGVAAAGIGVGLLVGSAWAAPVGTLSPKALAQTAGDASAMGEAANGWMSANPSGSAEREPQALPHLSQATPHPSVPADLGPRPGLQHESDAAAATDIPAEAQDAAAAAAAATATPPTLSDMATPARTQALPQERAATGLPRVASGPSTAAVGKLRTLGQRLAQSSLVRYWSESENQALVLAGLGALLLLAKRRRAH